MWALSRRKWRYARGALQHQMLVRLLERDGMGAVPRHVHYFHHEGPLPSRRAWTGRDTLFGEVVRPRRGADLFRWRAQTRRTLHAGGEIDLGRHLVQRPQARATGDGLEEVLVGGEPVRRVAVVQAEGHEVVRVDRRDHPGAARPPRPCARCGAGSRRGGWGCAPAAARGRASCRTPATRTSLPATRSCPRLAGCRAAPASAPTGRTVALDAGNRRCGTRGSCSRSRSWSRQWKATQWPSASMRARTSASRHPATL